MEPQAVTNIVETDGVNELGVKQRHHVTPMTEGAGEFSRAQIAGQLGDPMRRNEMAKLPQHGQLGTGWRTFGFCFHLDRLAENRTPANLFPHRLGDACDIGPCFVFQSIRALSGNFPVLHPVREKKIGMSIGVGE